MSINGCDVITGEASQIEPGHRYLAFLNPLDGPFAIPNANLILIREDGQLEDEYLPFLKGSSLETVREGSAMNLVDGSAPDA